jgi:hypothetical protein
MFFVRAMYYRVESFIEHQDTCNAGRTRADLSPACGGGEGVAAAAGSVQQAPAPAPPSLSWTASSTSPSSDIVISPAAWPGPPAMPSRPTAAFHRLHQVPSPQAPPEHLGGGHNLELQLMPPFSSSAGRAVAAPGLTAYSRLPRPPAVCSERNNTAATHLELSIGVSGDGGGEALIGAARANEEEAREQLRQAMAEKAAADEARAQAKRHAELAEQELASAKRMRRQAQVELSRAHALCEHAVRQVNATLLQITCLSCRHKFRARPPVAMSAEAVVCSYVSSLVTEGGDAEVDESLDADGVMRRRQDTKLMDVL